MSKAKPNKPFPVPLRLRQDRNKTADMVYLPGNMRLRFRAANGAEYDEPQNIRLYERIGFTEKVKDCRRDPCAIDKYMPPVYEETAWVLLKKEL